MTLRGWFDTTAGLALFASQGIMSRNTGSHAVQVGSPTDSNATSAPVPKGIAAAGPTGSGRYIADFPCASARRTAFAKSW